MAPELPPGPHASHSRCSQHLPVLAAALGLCRVDENEERNDYTVLPMDLSRCVGRRGCGRTS